MTRTDNFISKTVFYLVPIAIVLAGVYFVMLAPSYRQHLMIDFFAVYYAVILFCKWQFGWPVRNKPAILPEKYGRAIPSALQQMALYEYEYVQETMAQAMNDRHTLINYFLLSAGVMLATLGAIYSQEGMMYSPYKNHIAITIGLFFCFVAWIYLMKIIRLRQAWCESCAAMNRIKEFFLRNSGFHKNPKASPFYWKVDTIPPADKKGTLFHLEAILISFLSALAIGFVSVLLLQADSWRTAFWIPASFFLMGFILLSATYFVFLEELPEESSAASSNSADLAAPAPGSSKVIVHGTELLVDDFFKVEKATLQFQKYDGTMSEPVERLNFERGHSAAILVHDAGAGEFIFVEQFRYPAYASNPKNGWLTEAIAGMIEEGEMPLEAALREAREETGYEVREAEALVEFYVSPGGSSEHISVFWGRLGAQLETGGGKAEEQENIRLVRMPVTEAYQKLEQGFFKDAKTIVALQAVQHRVRKG
ncbi:MAG: NUDIX domain-containing protein [bacterium]